MKQYAEQVLATLPHSDEPRLNEVIETLARRVVALENRIERSDGLLEELATARPLVLYGEPWIAKIQAHLEMP